MDSIFESGQIIAGVDVYGSDGAKVGTITAIQPDYVVVGVVTQQDDLLSSDYSLPTSDCYIPISAIISDDDGTVYLTVASDQVLTMGWVTEPAVGESAAPVEPDYISAPTYAAEASGFGEAAPEVELGGETAWSNEDSVSYEVTTVEADLEPTGGAEAHHGEGFAAWAEEHDPSSHADLNAGNSGTQPDSFGQDNLNSSTREPNAGAGWRSGNVFAEGFVEAPIGSDEMDPVNRDRITADADFVTDPGGWSDLTIDAGLRGETCIDDDGSFASTSDIRYDVGVGDRGEDDRQRRQVTDRVRAVRSSSGMRGDRTRTRDGRIRTKRGDTLVGSVEEKYNLNFGVRSDMHLSTLLARRGVESLSELLRATEAEVSSSDKDAAQGAQNTSVSASKERSRQSPRR